MGPAALARFSVCEMRQMVPAGVIGHHRDEHDMASFYVYPPSSLHRCRQFDPSNDLEEPPHTPFLFGPAETLQVETVPVIELDAFLFQQALLEGIVAISR